VSDVLEQVRLAQVRLAAADAAAPLTRPQWEHLRDDLDALAEAAGEPDVVRELYGEHLAWLEPDGRFA
jgi:hypothetical protein